MANHGATGVTTEDPAELGTEVSAAAAAAAQAATTVAAAAALERLDGGASRKLTAEAPPSKKGQDMRAEDDADGLDKGGRESMSQQEEVLGSPLLAMLCSKRHSAPSRPRPMPTHGLLKKRGALNTAMKERFCLLEPESASLRYYEPVKGQQGPTIYTSCKEKGIVDLEDTTTLMCTEEDKKAFSLPPFSFKICLKSAGKKAGRVYFFAAPNDEELTRWLEALLKLQGGKEVYIPMMQRRATTGEPPERNGGAETWERVERSESTESDGQIPLNASRALFPTSSFKACSRCRKAFKPLVRRRYHCRQCGMVFCGDCTRGRKALISPEDGKLRPNQRVCPDCLWNSARKEDGVVGEESGPEQHRARGGAAGGEGGGGRGGEEEEEEVEETKSEVGSTATTRRRTSSLDRWALANGPSNSSSSGGSTPVARSDNAAVAIDTQPQPLTEKKEKEGNRGEKGGSGNGSSQQPSSSAKEVATAAAERAGPGGE